MRPATLGALLTFALGLVLVALAALEGGAHLALLVIVPVVYGSSLLFGLGVLLVAVGLVLLFLSAATGPASEIRPGGTTPPQNHPSSSTSVGGVVLLGPFPVIFGSNPKWTPYLIVLAVVIIVAFIVAALLWAGGTGTILVP